MFDKTKAAFAEPVKNATAIATVALVIALLALLVASRGAK